MDQTALIEVLACLSAASFHFAAGSIFGFSAILIPQLESADTDIVVSKNDVSWIASIVALVTPLSSLITGYLVDKLGRVNTIRLAVVPYLVGWLCIAVAQDFRVLLLGRFLTGFSLAVGCNPAVVYIAEVARAEFRGTLSCLAPSLTSFGMVVVYTKGAFLHWRTVAWLCMSYSILPFIFITLWSPESPVWLVSKGRSQDAAKSLQYLFRRDKKAGEVEIRLAQLTKEHTSQQSRLRGSGAERLIRAFARPNGYKPLLILTALFFFQQFSGIYMTIFYAVSFFENVGTSVNAYTSTIGIGLVRLIMGLVTSFLLRSFGRRTLYIFSGIGMTVFISTSGYFTREISLGHMEKNVIPAVCILLYMIVAVIGLTSIPWTMSAELFSMEIRGMAQGIIIGIANIIMFAALKIYPFLDDLLGGPYAVQWMFAAVSLASVVFIFIFLPETHGKELAEIQEYLIHNTIYILRKDKKPPVENVTQEEITTLKENV